MAIRLLSKYNRYNLLLSFVILIIGGISYTMIIRWLLVRQLNLELAQEKAEIVEFVDLHRSLPSPMSFKGQIVTYKDTTEKFKEKIKNEYAFSASKEGKRKKFHIYRSIEFPLVVNGKIVSCKVLRSQAETEDMIQLLLLCTFSLGVLLFIFVFLSNRFLFRKLWKPFQLILSQMQGFKLANNSTFHEEKTDIKEFQELNLVAKEMTDQAKNDYNSLKDFTENASHEIQTPLAIIKSKLELLMQSGNIQQSDIENIEGAYEASIRLSRLNKALLLMTKIENNQYHQSELVSLTQLTDQLVGQYDEMIRNAGIKISHNYKENIVLQMDIDLAEIMIGNLIRNAIKHNLPQDGFIHISIANNEFVIINSGPPVNVPTEKLFERFQKNSQSKSSLGLGLAIVQKITAKYNFQVKYMFENGDHKISILFSNII